MSKTIYSLKLHEYLRINDNLVVQKVPNGFNYIYSKKLWEEERDCFLDEIEQVVFVKE